MLNPLLLGGMNALRQGLLKTLWCGLLDCLGNQRVASGVTLAGRVVGTGVVDGIWNSVLNALGQFLLGCLGDYCTATWLGGD